MKIQRKSLVAGLAIGAGVLAGIGINGVSAADTPRPAMSRAATAAQTDIGKMSPLAELTGYSYTLELKATGQEARLTLEDYDYLGVQQSDRLALSVKGVVVGTNAQSTVTLGSAREVNWRSGDRFETKANNDTVEKWDGPFDDGDFDDTSLYAAQQYWDEALLPWFEANRSGFICSPSLLPLGQETRECAFDGLDQSALYDLLDEVSYGSFDEFTKLEVRATFSARTNAPVSVIIVAAGADELGAATSLDLTLKVGEVNRSSLALPPAPSAR